ncbi:hypothetical protein AVEN_10318-1 [Araneus ventricosus]|uniref:CCHC-type domain-containing protein n=1 Tax=Araneus ventricosus TaxID=182803 RepID=A0A4Y2X2H8_ARAVE|nr:hypothetical protein AVEN_10318-1 [Araneus ventricosus]
MKPRKTLSPQITSNEVPYKVEKPFLQGNKRCTRLVNFKIGERSLGGVFFLRQSTKYTTSSRMSAPPTEPADKYRIPFGCVRTYIPNPLRCFKCQRFGHSKTSCRGTLTCARCAEVGHESTDCTRTEKCVNCKGEHTSFSRNCFAWKQEKEIITTKIKKQISYQEARKLVKSQRPTPGNSYVSVAKKSISASSADRNRDISVSVSKPSDSTTRSSPPITNSLIPSSPSVAPVSEEALASPDFTDFKPVSNRKKLKKNSPIKTNNTISEKISKFYTTSHREVKNPVPAKDNISTHQSVLKPLATPKPTSVDTELLPMAAPQGHIFFRCDGLHDPEVP